VKQLRLAHISTLERANAPSAAPCGTAAERRPEGSLSWLLSQHRRMRSAGLVCQACCPQACSQGSQRRRPELLDAGILRPAQPAAVETDPKRIRWPIFALYGPKPPLGSSTSSNGYSLQKGPLRRPVETTRILIAVGGPAPIAPGANSVASALSASPGATPAKLCEHTMRVSNQPSK
jgi:hypothetical protein